MTDDQRFSEYVICRKRGHKPMVITHHDLDVGFMRRRCDFCETVWKITLKLQELNPPNHV